MQKKKLLIAEGSEEMAEALAELFRGSCQVRLCNEGNMARQMISRFRPDVLVLDLMLPGYDGLSLLQWANNQGFRPQVLATSRFCSDYVVETAQSLGVRYLMLKPCGLSAVAARISDLMENTFTAETVREPDSGLRTRLMSLNIPVKLRGCTYLLHAISLYAADPLQSVTKVLYPEVAKRCCCDPTHVERSIRSAIEAGWKHRDETVWKLYFPTDEICACRRPTNTAFIARMAQSLEKDREKWKENAEIVQNIPENSRDVRV